jgi:prepilin-type N-terminal cleavage/methylation domain-containing protein/prepilin-type processing-associated H-X9-DG protein
MKRSRGFTLVELLVVIAIIGTLVGLLLPAVQAARESARRSACSNNLKQIGIALHNYHDAKKRLPSGGYGTVVGDKMGWSQWVELLPFMEQNDIYTRFNFTAPNAVPGLPVDFINAGSNGSVASQARVTVFRCPSSSFGWSAANGGNGHQVPQYFGIAGANTFGRFTSTDQLATNGNGWGKTSNRGMIPNCRRAGVVSPLGVELKMCTDGTSKTLLVGEISSRISNAAGGAKQDRRPGSTVGWSQAGWGNTGHTSIGHMNSVTIRYPPNAAVEGQDGVGTNGWHIYQYGNCPLASEHPGGVQVVFADGSTTFISDMIDLELLTLMAVRDDGFAISQ